MPEAAGLADYVLAERGHVIHAAEHATVRGPGQNEALTRDPNLLASRYPGRQLAAYQAMYQTAGIAKVGTA